MTKKKPKKSAAEVAVGRFEAAQGDLRKFMEDNDEFIDELRRLVDEHNATLKEAQVALKGELKRSDDDRLVVGQLGVQKKRKEFWDGNALAALFPARISELFLEEHVSYEVNVTKLEQMIRHGEVDRDKAFKAFEQKSPTMAMMPGCPKELII